MTSSTSTSIEWTSGGHGLLGALPRSYQVTPKTPPTGDERHSKRWSGPTADSLKESQLAASHGAFTLRRTSPTNRIKTASLGAEAADAGAMLRQLRSTDVDDAEPE